MAQRALKMPQPGTVRSMTTGVLAVMSLSTVHARVICQTCAQSLNLECIAKPSAKCCQFIKLYYFDRFLRVILNKSELLLGCQAAHAMTLEGSR